jgi:hypothetical protein
MAGDGKWAILQSQTMEEEVLGRAVMPGHHWTGQGWAGRAGMGLAGYKYTALAAVPGLQWTDLG